MVHQYVSFTVNKFESANTVLSGPVNDENRKKKKRKNIFDDNDL